MSISCWDSMLRLNKKLSLEEMEQRIAFLPTECESTIISVKMSVTETNPQACMTGEWPSRSVQGQMCSSCPLVGLQ